MCVSGLGVTAFANLGTCQVLFYAWMRLHRDHVMYAIEVVNLGLPKKQMDNVDGGHFMSASTFGRTHMRQTAR